MFEWNAGSLGSPRTIVFKYGSMNQQLMSSTIDSKCRATKVGCNFFICRVKFSSIEAWGLNEVQSCGFQWNEVCVEWGLIQ